MNIKPVLEPQQVTLDVLKEKYCKGHEHSARDVRARVAKALAAVEDTEGKRIQYEQEFMQAMEDGFVPAGRINSAAGTGIRATLINCFVQPMSDSVSEYDFNARGEAVPSIYGALQEAAETLRRGGGVGYDFSPIRPYGALVGGTFSRSSGPISYMNVFNASCATIESAGARRGAQMGAIRIDHPDVLRFVHAKDEKGALTYFNISVAVTDVFMDAVENGKLIQLWHEAKPHPDFRSTDGVTPFQREDGMWVYDVIEARALWDEIMRSTYDHAEPGILFIDRINRDNNLWYRETIATTNPCGEQPLPPYACCCLGSINLTKFVDDPFAHNASFDLGKFKRVVRTAVRMLDNVLEATYWPLEQQRAEAMAKRRIGLGFLGLGDMLAMLGIPYDSMGARSWAESIAVHMRDEAYRASIALAQEKGAFPALERDKYLESGFAQRLPTEIRAGIAAHGIRNSHLLSIAPTGTITLAFADNASNGIEPAYMWTYTRKKREPDLSWKEYVVEDHAYRLWKAMHWSGLPQGDAKLPEYFVDALSIGATDHMLMMAAVQPYIDTSISKTVNIPADYPYDQFKSLYFDAWRAGCKGLATYRPNDTLGAVLSATPEATTKEAKTAFGLEELVREFSAAMVQRLREKEAEGYYGWDDDTNVEAFQEGFARNMLQGDHIDAANFLAMLWHHECLPTKEGQFSEKKDPRTCRLDSRPEGDLEGATTKVEYWTVDGKKVVYITANSTWVQGARDGREVSTLRPVEFFVPSQVGEGQQWISTAMRLLSLLARSGGSVAKALKNMREVVWDKGPVRCGFAEKADGTKVPRYHDSEAAAIGYAIQQLLIRQGMLDEEGNEPYEPEATGDVRERSLEPVLTPLANDVPTQSHGKKCEECGAHAVHRVDGCERCSNCGRVGTCG